MAREFLPQKANTNISANTNYPPQGFQTGISRKGTALVQTDTITALVQTDSLTAIIQTGTG